MNHVYHVTHNGDGESGVFSSATMDAKYPSVFRFMVENDVSHMQFSVEGEEGQLIESQSREKFNQEAIQ